MDRLPPVASTSVDDIIRGFVPTRRFAHVAFDNYQPDPRYPSQLAARDRLRDFVAHLGQSRRAHLLQRLLKQLPERPQSIYLDGGYGVGKTTCWRRRTTPWTTRNCTCRLASWRTPSRAWVWMRCSSRSPRRACCASTNSSSTTSPRRAWPRRSWAVCSRAGVCLSPIVTTSNTLPSDLGQGRFAAEAFQREIGDIAARFEVVSIDGEDYRHRHWDEAPSTTSDVQDMAALRCAYAADPAPDSARALLDWPSLAEQLAAVHPVHYAQIATQLDALFLADLRRIDDQAVALRLVHFVDKLYDQEVRLTLTTPSNFPLVEIFSAGYRDGAYSKKYRRCLSRLHELLAETQNARGYSTTAPRQRAR